MAKKLVLASASPRRSEILSVAGFEFDIIPSKAEEISEGLPPEEAARANALLKAKDVFNKSSDGVVIGADTVVTIDGEILGKPKDREDAFNMLKSLSGRKHYVITGYAVISEDFETSSYCSTEVVFRDLSDKEIYAYIDTLEPMDKAGSYAIQEKGSLFIESMNGDFFNVVGLPVSEIAEILKKLGVYPIWQK
jgi:septum formation protein